MTSELLMVALITIDAILSNSSCIILITVEVTR
jgi:hypothetical protein